ncbi:hypothetical protein L6452_31981 [Arctium lappa]|uniref:Uncharacterized protein n=1 Tax=Arctium lappa TaxID=4217 RepID=A0ACB8Z3P6_ARCLA|nr:hypothetical protein L6452_31981 [Arctium lappa]
MGETTGNSSLLEHVAEAWYSVPELRLRDHHFTVPLDYSLSQSPKISVFACEAVAGSMDEPSSKDYKKTYRVDHLALDSLLYKQITSKTINSTKILFLL